MSEIDWSKAPEGAEYWRDGLAKWFKVESGDLCYWNPMHKKWKKSHYSLQTHHDKLLKRPDFQPFTSIEDANPDMVNHPPHYQSDNGIECIDAIRAALGRDGFIAYCIGNSMKYQWREKADKLEDMRKASWYLNRAIEEQSK